ncbi:MAG: hypothetical protein LPK01_00315 [Hymenobacteraceae bacterium]|nr:hypothetical protein [Hymenobacteraceae bacterium]
MSTLLDIPAKLVLAIPAASVYQVYYTASFIEAETKELTAQLLPWVKIPGCFNRKYYGPRERLRNISFLEFIFADTYFIHYTQNQEEELLNKFIACLYRERTWCHFIKRKLPNYSGDIRQPFNENLIEERARLLAKLPVEEKFAILTWYRGCRDYLEKEYPHVFSSDNQEKASKSGWDSVLRSMSQGVHTIDATGRVLIGNVLGVMEDRAIEIEEYERKNQNNEK